MIIHTSAHPKPHVALRCFTQSLVLLLLLYMFAPHARAQQPTPTTPKQQDAKSTAISTAPGTADEKSEQLVRRAVEALGGERYLAARTLIGRGLYTPFAKGVSQPPNSFVDYLAFPDRERTEFRGGGKRDIQTYDRQSGWIFDGATRFIKDMNKDQLADFRLALRTSLDNLLRGWWRREPGVTLTYVGRREAGVVGRRNEAVRLTYPNGFAVDFEFGAKDALPAKSFYKRQNAEGVETLEEDRYARYLNIEGLLLPFVVDHYRAGDQSSRINYDTIEINRPVPDAIFAKPANVKALK